MLVFVLLGRLLTPADFGLVAMVAVLLLGCQLILRSGFGVAIIQRERLDPDHLDAAFWANIGLGAGLMGLMVLISLLLGSVLDQPMLVPVGASLAPTLLPTAMAWTFHARLRRDMDYRALASSTLASILAGGIAGVLLAWHGAGVWSLVGQQVTGSIAALLVLALACPWRPRFRLSTAHLRDLASFSSRVVASQGLSFASQRLIPLILGLFLALPTVGLYVIASRLVWALANVSMFVIFDLSLVMLSRLQNESERHREGAYLALRMTSLVGLPLVVGAVFVADPVIQLVLGERWADSVLLFQILCLFSMFWAFTQCTQQIMLSAGRPGTALRLAALSAVLVPSLALASAPFGIVPATVAVGLAWLLAVPGAVLALRLGLGLSARRLLADQLPLWLAAAAMALGLGLLSLGTGGGLHPLLAAGGQLVGGLAVFPIVLLMLAPRYRRELAEVVRARASGMGFRPDAAGETPP